MGTRNRRPRWWAFNCAKNHYELLLIWWVQLNDWVNFNSKNSESQTDQVIGWSANPEPELKTTKDLDDYTSLSATNLKLQHPPFGLNTMSANFISHFFSSGAGFSCTLPHPSWRANLLHPSNLELCKDHEFSRLFLTPKNGIKNNTTYNMKKMQSSFVNCEMSQYLLDRTTPP